MHGKQRFGRIVATVVAVVALTVVVPTGAAQAGTTCSAWSGCSHVENADALTITARRNWTCSTGTTGTASTTCVSGASLTLYSGGQTPTNEDWDVVQVDGGWCYKIRFINWYGKDWTVRYDRRGTSNTYVKVENGSRAIVQDQSTSSCP